MTTGTRLRLRGSFGAAGVAAWLASLMLAGNVAAQSECSITVTPNSVSVGQQFTVAGNFGGAEVYLVQGADASPAAGAEPDATTPEGSSVQRDLHGRGGRRGTWIVWASIPATECGASAPLTITAGTAIPNTALSATGGPALVAGVLLLLISVLLVLARRSATRR
ncbi:MAG: hypothetical protein ABR509_01180 [Candidatus Limnocylindria bacterium]